jgi:hypothetical protein
MNDTKQDIEIAVIKTQVDAIFKKQDEMIEVMKDEFSKMKESYTRQITRTEVDLAEYRNDQRGVLEEHKKFLDDHCKRISILEKDKALFESDLRPIKKVYDNLAIFMIGFLITIGSVAVGLIYFLRDRLK